MTAQIIDSAIGSILIFLVFLVGVLASALLETYDRRHDK